MSTFNPPKQFIRRYTVLATAIWIVLLVAFAIFMFVMPHDPGFAPEVGVLGSFIFFSVGYSFCYVVLAWLVGAIAYFVAGVVGKST